MKMKTKDVNGVCIVDIEEDSISTASLKDLKNLFKERSNKKRIGLNLGDVKTLKHDFLDFLKDAASINKISLYNLTNDAYLMLFISKYDAYADIYLDEADFITKKRPIIYRRLKLLKSA